MSDSLIRKALESVVSDLGFPETDIRLERPKDPEHGDWSTNLAMTLASRLRQAPRVIAQEIADRIDPNEAGIVSVEIAGPGFLNFRLSSGAVAGLLPRVLMEDLVYGRSDEGAGAPVMVEFVSANPTGPLHLGHGRQAALGDSISSLLEWTGWQVHREYYYNDSGKQIELLAESVLARYKELAGRASSVPDGGYQGEYVRDLAESFKEEQGQEFPADDSRETLEAIQSFAVQALRAEQDRDLAEFGLIFDLYFLESSLYTDGRVEATILALQQTGHVYELDEALWLKTTEYGDQKDRVMVRGNGAPTYFLPDVAYHMNKWERGFHRVINVQGSDHHGTVDRVRAGLQILGLPEGYPEYVLHQMVSVEKDGKEVKLSKRAGTATTFREIFSEVGVDVARWFFMMRKPEAHLVFDLDIAMDHSEKNPVYKVQYAHARMCSIFRKGGVEPDDISVEGARLEGLGHELERDLIKRLGEFPETVTRAASARAPHVLCEYLEQTAGAVNSWYHAGNPSRDPGMAVLVDDPELRLARLALARGVQIVLRNGLTILGVSAPTRMDRPEEEQQDA